MTTPPRYRPIAFGSCTLQVTKNAKGHTYVQATETPKEYPLRLTDRLIHWAQTAPDRTFMARRDEHGDWRKVSYAQALETARHIGQTLLDRKLSVDRPVLILSDNDLEHGLLALGCQYVGIPYAPLSPAYSLLSQDFAKLQHAVNTLTPGLVFSSSSEAFAKAIDTTLAGDVEWVVTKASSTPRKATLFSQLEATAVTPEVDAAFAATGPDTIVKFLFTSGSTGLPKAVVNTQRMLCSSMQMVLQAWPFLADEPPVFLDWLPWNHTFGGNHSVGIALFNGGTMYIDDGKPTPALIGETIRNLHEISPTAYFNVPKGWEEVAKALEADPVLCKKYYSRLKVQFYAGASLSQPVWDKLEATAEATCGERIAMTSGLGMTETAPCALFVMKNNVRAGEVGLPLPGMILKLVPNGDKLELRYRGPNVMPGYWRAPEQTKAVFDEEGYLCSGDALKWIDPNDPNAGFMFDGRVAEDFKLNSGTWVSVGPLRLRAANEGAPYLQDSVVTGHDRSELGLLILPNIEQCRRLAQAGADASAADVLAAPPVREFFQGMVNRLYRQGTGGATKVERALILIDPPSLDKGEITDKGAINQRAMLTHRAAQVQALYNNTTKDLITPEKD